VSRGYRQHGVFAGLAPSADLDLVPAGVVEADAPAAAQVADLTGPLVMRPGAEPDPVLRMRASPASNSASLAGKAQ